MRRATDAAIPIALAAGLVACRTSAPTATPLGEVLVVVDTDATVPGLVARLRVDLRTLDGAWYEAHDLPAFKAASWPVSFAVTLAQGEAAKDVIVRLRAYPEAKVRDYLGERFVAAPSSFCSQAECFDTTLPLTAIPACCPTAVPPALTPFATGSCPTCPRLMQNGADATPASEPLPGLTIDTLLAVHLVPGTRGAIRVTLRSACFGTMADLYGLRACVDTAGQRVDVGYASVDPDLTVFTPSQLVGTWGQAVPCTATPRAASTAPDGTPLHDDEVCVSGGAFVLGGRSAANGVATDDLPERVALVRPFLMDRYEVTVGRFRAAIASGFTGGVPSANDGPIVSTTSNGTYCTWSDAPMGREEFPVTCLTDDVARAFCRYEGGDLPLEAQWEYAAAATGRAGRTYYPWGNGDGTQPACAQVVYSRVGGGQVARGYCFASGLGPAAVTSQPGDVTALGIVGMGGNVSELTTGLFAAPGAGCWLGAGPVEPSCALAGSEASRGGSWTLTAISLLVTSRQPFVAGSSYVDTGMRCVRSGSGP